MLGKLVHVGTPSTQEVVGGTSLWPETQSLSLSQTKQRNCGTGRMNP